MSRGEGGLRYGGWVSAASIGLALVLWEVSCQQGWVEPVLLSPPSKIATTAWALLSEGGLNEDLAFTLEVFGWSVAVALFVGVVVGLAMGFSPWVYHALNPFIVTANALPKIVLMPLVILWLGISMKANVFLGALMASFPIIVNVHAGVRALDADLIGLARAYRAPRALVLRAIILPGVTPYLLSGLRVAVSYAMVGVLIAEFFASSKGVGYRMVLYMANFQVDAFFVCMALVAVFSLACTGAVHMLERRVEGWRPAAFRTPGM